jgi:hypothetical protein
LVVRRSNVYTYDDDDDDDDDATVVDQIVS